MTEFATTTQIVDRAREVLAQPLWDYVAGGAETETTVLRNREAINALAFRPRVLRNVATIDTSTTLLGSALRIPFLLAPCGSLQQLTPAGAVAQVRAATAWGTLPVVSSVCEPDLETSAAASPRDKWFQLYVRGDFDWLTAIVGRVRSAGFRVLVLTVDTAIYGNRERQKLLGWLPPSRRTDYDETPQAAFDWATFDRLRAVAGIPIVIKGILTAEDAELAVEHGAAGVWVSNHGGRQLDHALGTLDVLPEIAHAVGGRVPIVIDGGFARGTDIIKALALGATAVAAGRMYCYALAAGGEAGVERMLDIIEFELKTSMGLLGVTNIAAIDRSYVTRAAPLSGGPPAFPFLRLS